MNRHTLVYLFISLTMVSLVFGSLSFAAAETSIMPVGLTETFTPVPPTDTPVPTETPAPTEMPTNTPAPTETPTNTPAPTQTPTNTPAPTQTPTNTPAPTNAPEKTNTPVPTPAYTPTAPAVVGLPNTGGAAPQGGASPWSLLLVAAVAGSLGALAFGLSIRAHRPTRR